MDDSSCEPVVLAGDEDRERTRQELAVLTQDLPEPAGAHDPVGTVERHRAFCSRLVRSGPWELPARSEVRCICGTVDFAHSVNLTVIGGGIPRPHE